MEQHTDYPGSKGAKPGNLGPSSTPQNLSSNNIFNEAQEGIY